MKHDAKSRGCRLDLSVSELEVLLHLARRGRDALSAAGLGVASHQHLIEPTIRGLGVALNAQREKVTAQRSAASARRVRQAGPSRTTDRSLVIAGHQVRAVRGDYVDTGSADFAHWQDLRFLEAMNRTPAQAEVRRDVWYVSVFTTPEERVASDRYFVGCDTTSTGDFSEVEQTAQRILNAAISRDARIAA